MADEVVIYSDGGGELGVSAGSGCIVEVPAGTISAKLAAFLGVATNNEAEIFAGLMGFAFLNHYEAEHGEITLPIRWVCDSEYTLKSATEYIVNWQRNGWKTANKKPVKNQGLWRAYLALSKGREIIPEHVRGHTGHPENEACDLASNYVRAEGATDLEVSPGGIHASLADGLDNGDWLLLDGREQLDTFRNEAFEDDWQSSFANRLSV